MNPILLGAASAMLATLVWSGNFIVARGVGEAVSPVTLAALRWSTATIVILPFTLHIIRREWHLVRKHLRHLSLSALLGVTVFNTLIYVAAHTTTALNLSLIATTTPVFIILLSRVLLGEVITVNRMIGLTITVTGILTLITQGDYQVLTGLDFHDGDIWMLLAGFIWAVYTIVLKSKPQEMHPYGYLGVTFSMGVVPLVIGAIIEQSITPHLNLTPTVMGSVLYIGIGASILSYLMWTRAIALAGPVVASFIYYTLPLFCAVEAFLFLGEPVTPIHGLAFLLIISGIVLATHPRFQRK